ncbi:MAG TPA: DUF1549 domain-containing protein, partial [Blastocatellia bacterium]|nr:DUF1549 domain-containing protein [Blastocatellia bacterium]
MFRAGPAKSAFKAFVVLAFGLGSGLGWVSASQQPNGPVDLFRDQVAPVFAANCVFCHGAKVQRSGLDLRSQEATLRGGARGASVVPGDPGKSLLYRMAAHLEEPAMPLGGDKLKESDLAAIARWIESLPKDAVKPAAEAATPLRAHGTPITDKDRQFWSFQKPARPAVPAVKNRAWVRNAIDAFVLRRLEAKNLAPAPPAEPRVLLRRVYLDLTGLPPTPEQVEAFVADPSDAAYAKVVEQLLASPRYGERWGRH